MLAQITEEEFSKEVLIRTWYRVRALIRKIIFLYPLVSVIDIIYAKNVCLQFLAARVITIFIVTALYFFY